MDPIVEFAKMFRERNNPSVQGVGIGKVSSAPPDLVVLFNGLILDASLLVTSEFLTRQKETNDITVGEHGAHSHKVDIALKVGDSVIVIPSVDNSKYFIVGKVG